MADHPQTDSSSRRAGKPQPAVLLGNESRGNSGKNGKPGDAQSLSAENRVSSHPPKEASIAGSKPGGVSGERSNGGSPGGASAEKRSSSRHKGDSRAEVGGTPHNSSEKRASSRHSRSGGDDEQNPNSAHSRPKSGSSRKSAFEPPNRSAEQRTSSRHGRSGADAEHNSDLAQTPQSGSSRKTALAAADRPAEQRTSSRHSRTGGDDERSPGLAPTPKAGSMSGSSRKTAVEAPVRSTEKRASSRSSHSVGQGENRDAREGVPDRTSENRTSSRSGGRQEHGGGRRSQSRDASTGRRIEPQVVGSEQNARPSTSTSRRSGSISSSSRRRSSSAARAAGARNGDVLEARKAEAQEELTRRMEEAATHNFDAPDPAVRVTAAKKWDMARDFAQQCPEIEAWSGGFPGTFMFIPNAAGAGSAPSFQHKADDTKWLYLSANCAWWLGAASAEHHRQSGAQMPKADKGLLRSVQVKPGTLPHQVQAWEALVGSDWVHLSNFKFWLSEDVVIEWLKMTIDTFDAPVLSIRGTGVNQCDGLYDVVSKSGALSGKPPKFRHQQFSEKWLYLAKDQRWCIGDTADMEARANRNTCSSGFIQPGCHPKDAGKWERTLAGLEECVGMEIQCLRESARACDKWALANERSVNVEIWGKEAEFGEFQLVPGVMSEPPTYQHRLDKTVWLYLSTDGCWWMSDAENKSKSQPKGWLVSELCEPGTLPQDVKTWSEATENGSWKVNSLVKAMVGDSINIAWEQARQEVMDSQVIDIQGVDDLDLDGFFDFVPGEGSKHDPPVFQHQENQDLWLYVATDCRWWVGAYANMQRRLPRGKLHSSAMLPGTLPARVKSWLVYDSETKEFDIRDSVIVS